MVPCEGPQGAEGGQVGWQPGLGKVWKHIPDLFWEWGHWPEMINGGRVWLLEGQAIIHHMGLEELEQRLPTPRAKRVPPLALISGAQLSSFMCALVFIMLIHNCPLAIIDNCGVFSFGFALIRNLHYKKGPGFRFHTITHSLLFISF